ncbi:MAG: 3-methyl-2-oxobutanoate hydroxymethyltransferase [Dysgonamonadaceae bacterium]|jgi:3-methyl-2-oxobutanoate hydroxymethyltransferase|nr:3-methyl-2-oxobutanoate hydroxymethyltransferase [Dysgonamonadaceae bacterium]
MNQKFTVNSFRQRKAKGQKIAMLTAYDYSTARLLDEAGIDVLLVGDSLGMVVQGNENTLPVTVEEMIYHGKAVKKGTKNAFVLVDMPFLSYHVSIEDAVRNAGRIIKETGADAVKIEGGDAVIAAVSAIINAQIPVVGHLGLTPQSVNVFGGFKVQGKNSEQAQKIIDQAKRLEQAGVCSIVLECVPWELSRVITDTLTIPTIGIGAGKYCDGQVLVVNDMLGMSAHFAPKFVKRFADMDAIVKDAVENYIREVNAEDFPTEQHSFASNNETYYHVKTSSAY